LDVKKFKSTVKADKKKAVQMGPQKTKQNSPDNLWCDFKQDRTDNLTRSSHKYGCSLHRAKMPYKLCGMMNKILSSQ